MNRLIRRCVQIYIQTNKYILTGSRGFARSAVFCIYYMITVGMPALLSKDCELLLKTTHFMVAQADVSHYNKHVVFCRVRGTALSHCCLRYVIRGNVF